MIYLLAALPLAALLAYRLHARRWPSPAALAAGAVSAAVAVGAWLLRTPRAPREEVPMPPPSTGTTERATRTAGQIVVENGSARRIEIDRAAENPDDLADVMRGQR